MRFPEGYLTPGEVLHLHIHRHWRSVAIPTFWLVLLTLAFGVVCFLLPPPVVFVLLALVYLIALSFLVIRPFSIWRTTQFAFTSERVMVRRGVIRIHNSDVPMTRLDNVSSEQGPLDRIMRCGTLRFGPSAQPEANKLHRIPDVEKVQKLVNTLIRAAGHTKGADVQTLEAKEARKPEPAPAPVAPPALGTQAPPTAPPVPGTPAGSAAPPDDATKPAQPPAVQGDAQPVGS